MIVSIDEPMLRAMNGSFPITELRNVFREWILSRGYQSKIRSTTGRLTAIGLLIRARVKKQRAKRKDRE